MLGEWSKERANGWGEVWSSGRVFVAGQVPVFTIFAKERIFDSCFDQFVEVVRGAGGRGGNEPMTSSKSSSSRAGIGLFLSVNIVNRTCFQRVSGEYSDSPGNLASCRSNVASS